MNIKKLETKNATTEENCLFRVQIPTDDVSKVIESITNVVPLNYGNYDQVIFRYNTGIQQYRPLDGSKTGEAELVHAQCDEISFTVPKDDEIISTVIEAIFESHPHEEPVIIIQEVICSRFKYGYIKDNIAEIKMENEL
ncbi:MAG: hypothetical protein L3J71_15310 [Victivallaceae bacterium]|nr:hypothetical protein [Victivallaceae bacterium]